MKNYAGLRYSGVLTALLGLFWTFTDHSSFGPIAMTFGIIFAAFAIFRDKKQNLTFAIIMAAALMIMLGLEYFLVPVQSTTFYMLLLIMSIGTFMTFCFSLKPQNLLSRREKIVSYAGSILFGISLFGLMGFILNNFILSLIMGVFTLIMLVISRVMHRRISKDDALKDEFDTEYTTKNHEGYWFRYEIGGGVPKPVRWQGWACYAIVLLSPLVALVFDPDPTTGVALIVASIFGFIIIAMLKSNYRQSVREYRENLKKEGD